MQLWHSVLHTHKINHNELPADLGLHWTSCINGILYERIWAYVWLIAFMSSKVCLLTLMLNCLITPSSCWLQPTWHPTTLPAQINASSSRYTHFMINGFTPNSASSVFIPIKGLEGVLCCADFKTPLRQIGNLCFMQMKLFWLVWMNEFVSSVSSQQHHGKIRKTNFLKKNEKVIVLTSHHLELH